MFPGSQVILRRPGEGVVPQIHDLPQFTGAVQGAGHGRADEAVGEGLWLAPRPTKQLTAAGPGRV